VVEGRKVLKVKNSLFVCIPAGVCELAEIEKGDTLLVSYVPSIGIVFYKPEWRSPVPASVEVPARLKQIADNLYEEFRRKARGLEAQFTANMMSKWTSRLMGEVLRGLQRAALSMVGGSSFFLVESGKKRKRVLEIRPAKVEALPPVNGGRVGASRKVRAGEPGVSGRASCRVG